MGFKKTSALTATSTSALSAGGASTGPAFITATSNGTVTTFGNYTIHTFLSSGTFTVTAGINKAIEYLIVAGGGGGGFANGGSGGGAGGGGFLESFAAQVAGVDFSGARIFVNKDDVFTVTVGAGGAAYAGTSPTASADGVNSSIVGGAYNVTAIGGGAGGPYTSNQMDPKGRDGGSSGAAGYNTVNGMPGQCVLSPRQGYRGSTSGYGGGGAGGNGSSNSGGAGRASSISGSSVTYSAGGSSLGSVSAAAANTGKGGDTLSTSGVGANGGSGIVIIRYLFQ